MGALGTIGLIGLALDAREIFFIIKSRFDKKGVDEAEASIKKLEKTQVQASASVNKSLSSLFDVLAAGAAVYSTAIKAFNLSSQFEDTEVAIKTFVKDTELAEKTIENLVDFAANNPIPFENVTTYGKRLLAVGFQANQLTEVLGMLGNVAAGVGKESFPFLARALSQVRTAGNLRGQELIQFSEAGLPLLQALAQRRGVKESEVQDLISRRKISFEEVYSTIKSMTEGSGRFAGLLKKMSNTASGIVQGIISAFKAGVVLGAKEFRENMKVYGRIIRDWLKDNRKRVSDFVQFFLGSFTRVIENFGKNVLWAKNTFIDVYKILGKITRLKIKGAGFFDLFGKTVSFSVILRTMRGIFGLSYKIQLIFLSIFGVVQDIIAYIQGKRSFLGNLLKRFPETMLFIKKILWDLYIFFGTRLLKRLEIFGIKIKGLPKSLDDILSFIRNLRTNKPIIDIIKLIVAWKLQMWKLKLSAKIALDDMSIRFKLFFVAIGGHINRMSRAFSLFWENLKKGNVLTGFAYLNDAFAFGRSFKYGRTLEEIFGSEDLDAAREKEEERDERLRKKLGEGGYGISSYGGFLAEKYLGTKSLTEFTRRQFTQASRFSERKEKLEGFFGDLTTFIRDLDNKDKRSSPKTKGKRDVQSVNISAPINVSVPQGADMEEAGRMFEEKTKMVFQKILNYTESRNEANIDRNLNVIEPEFQTSL